MWVWRAVLRVSAQQHPQSGHTAIDSTFFNRRAASSYHRQRSGNSVQTLKVTTVTDVESLAVLDVHISARWKHDTKTGPQVVRRNADDLLPVAADKVFHNWHTKFQFYPTVSSHRSYNVDRDHSRKDTTRLSGQAATLSTGWPKPHTRQRSTRSAMPCERWAGIDSSVKSSSCSLSPI